jgi:asparagine synthase (glutamine-hydrolysing)
MCGICGLVTTDASERIDPATIIGMRDVLRHRGPDDAGVYTGGGIGLGHRRLSIIDLSAAGHQPMSSNDGSRWIVFNGEVYNYLELRREHLGSAYRFASSSDTEVILHMYDAFGEDCVKYFNGMFAFAIWDVRERRLFLARDRVGVKPLYYTQQQDTFLFASEIKALLQHDKVRVEIDPTAVDDFMTFGYVQSPRTIFKGIYRLPEGHTLTWQDGRTSIRQYWDLTFQPDEATPLSEQCEELVALLDDSLRLRMRSDVPLGVLLSGGVDSSAVTALLSRSVGQVKTFSIGYDAGSDFNELSYAKQIAQQFGTDHYDLILEPRSFEGFIPKFVYHMDEPVTEGAAISLYFICELTARHVKVVLSGEGSDELFAGYPIYHYMRLIEAYRQLPSALREYALAPLLRAVTRSPKIDKYLYLSTQPLERRYLGVHLYDDRAQSQLYSSEFRARLGTFDSRQTLLDLHKQVASADVLSRLLYVDTKTWLPNDILIKADRMSMATSIELREPFLDYRLIEFAARVPSRYKIRNGKTKYILKEALKGVLPHNILHRPKMGFPTPLAKMFRGDLYTYVRDVLLDPRSAGRGYFDRGVVATLIEEHLSGRVDHHSILWRLLILEEWHRQFADAPRSAVAA